MYSDQPFPNCGVYADHRGIGDDRERQWPEDWLTSLLRHELADFQLTSLENLILQGCLTRTNELDTRSKGNPVAVNTPSKISWSKEIGDRVKLRTFINATELGCSLYAEVKG